VARDLSEAAIRRIPKAAAWVRFWICRINLVMEKWYWGRLSPTTCVSPVNSLSTNFSIVINHPTIIRCIVSILSASLNDLRKKKREVVATHSLLKP
jgi:hypothetical protein